MDCSGEIEYSFFMAVFIASKSKSILLLMWSECWKYCFCFSIMKYSISEMPVLGLIGVTLSLTFKLFSENKKKFGALQKYILTCSLFLAAPESWSKYTTLVQLREKHVKTNWSMRSNVHKWKRLKWKLLFVSISFRAFVLFCSFST